MEVSILAKGETSRSTWLKEGVGAVTIAVNDALVLHPTADWLVMLDMHVLYGNPVPGHIQPMVGLRPAHGVLTYPRRVDRTKEYFPGLIVRGTDCLQWPRMPRSGMAAVLFAGQVLKARLIHLHGFDLGGNNINGRPEPTGDARWVDERKRMQDICDHLAASGVEVRSYGAWKPVGLSVSIPGIDSGL